MDSCADQEMLEWLMSMYGKTDLYYLRNSQPRGEREPTHEITPSAFYPGLWQYWLTLGVAVIGWINSVADVAHSWLSTFRGHT